MNETKIFVAWLIKYIKKDKRITGKELARRVGCDPTTISSYKRRRTKPDYEMRCKILKAVDMPYEKMMEEGRRELKAAPPSLPIPTHPQPTPNRPKTDLEKQIEKDCKKIMRTFKYRDLVIEIAKTLLEIEKTGGRDELLRVQGSIEDRLQALLKKNGYE